MTNMVWGQNLTKKRYGRTDWYLPNVFVRMFWQIWCDLRHFHQNENILSKEYCQ
jgi:hypothetical protein